MKNNTKILISAIISVLLIGAVIFASLASDVVVADEEISSDAAEVVTDAELVTEDAKETESEAVEPASEDISEGASEEESIVPERTIVLGDVDGDGDIQADDARLALRGSARLENLSITQLFAADVDENGVLHANDARQILRFSARLQNSFVKANAEQTSEAASEI